MVINLSVKYNVYGEGWFYFYIFWFFFLPSVEWSGVEERRGRGRERNGNWDERGSGCIGTFRVPFQEMKCTSGIRCRTVSHLAVCAFCFFFWIVFGPPCSLPEHQSSGIANTCLSFYSSFWHTFFFFKKNNKIK